ncbi:MAG TPA: hypothetical protein VFR23_13845 [Jiangellaceae bacterium]|nr:hypothetical protein [Jiangellaceae bacterium]
MPRERIATAPTSRANRVTVRPSESLSGNRTITVDEIERWQVLVFNPSTTSRTLTLPAEAACAGVCVYICNLGTSTGTLVVNNDGGTAVATIGVTAANDVSGGLFFCDGTDWRGMLGA